MNFFTRYASSIFAFLLGVFAAFYFKGCDKEVKPETIIKTVRVIDTQYVKTKQVKYVKGDTIWKDTTIVVDIIESVDTINILKDYYAKNVFIDSFKTKYGVVSVLDTIQFNKIKDRRYSADFSVPVVTVHDTVVVRSNKVKPALFWGVGGNFSKGGINGATTHLFLETSKRRIYGIGAGVFNGMPYYNVKVLIKL